MIVFQIFHVDFYTKLLYNYIYSSLITKEHKIYFLKNFGFVVFYGFSLILLAYFACLLQIAAVWDHGFEIHYRTVQK